MTHIHYAYKVSLERIYREQGGTLLKYLLATYKCYHSKIRYEGRSNKRYTHHNMLFKNYDSVYLETLGRS